MKNLISVNEVKKAFYELLNAYGQTTSLEVKKNLREKSFFVTQKMVSNAMKDITSEGEGIDFTITDNGVYKTYHLIKSDEDKAITQEKLDELNNNFNGLIYFY